MPRCDRNQVTPIRQQDRILVRPYKTAAFDGINRLGRVPILEPELEPAAAVGVVVGAD